jgi:hypothetical protein
MPDFPYGTAYPEAPWIDRDGQPIDDQPADDPPAQPVDVLAGMRNGAWLDAQVFPPLEYAVPGIIPEGFGLLVAPPKAGKSWLGAGIGLASAAGGIALGFLAVDKRPVLYLALEDGHRRLQDRFRKIMGGQPIPAGINVITRAHTHQVIPMVTEFLARHQGPALIVLDTLGKVKPPKRAGDDSYQMDYAIGGQLKDVIDSSSGSTLLVIHHTRKAESGDFVDAVSGTQGIAGSADFVLVLFRKRHSDDAVLAVTGRDIPEGEYALKADGGLWRLDGATLSEASDNARTRRESGNLGDRSIDALMFVNGRPLGTRASDLAEHLGIDNDTAGRYLRRLHEAGRIAKPTRGIYKPLSEASELSESDETAGDDNEPRLFDSDSSHMSVRNSNRTGHHVDRQEHHQTDASDASDTDLQDGDE